MKKPEPRPPAWRSGPTSTTRLDRTSTPRFRHNVHSSLIGKLKSKGLPVRMRMASDGGWDRIICDPLPGFTHLSTDPCVGEPLRKGKTYHTIVRTWHGQEDYQTDEAQRQVENSIEFIRHALRNRPKTILQVKSVRYLTSVTRLKGDSRGILKKIDLHLGWFRETVGQHPWEPTMSM